jgi:Domain of unknown function (DUF4388)
VRFVRFYLKLSEVHYYGHMKGSLEEISFINLAQFFAGNRHTGCLVVWILGGDEARVYFDLGRIVSAQCGALRGQEALEMLASKPQRGRFRFRFNQRTDGHNVTASSVSVLLEMGRRNYFTGFPIAS